MVFFIDEARSRPPLAYWRMSIRKCFFLLKASLIMLTILSWNLEPTSTASIRNIRGHQEVGAELGSDQSALIIVLLPAR